MNSNYKIYHYSIISSTEGCDFDLISEENIKDINDKNVNLNFVEITARKNITAKCILSSSNINKIPCSLSQEIHNLFSLESFLYTDKDKTITIFQSDTSNNLLLECTDLPTSIRSVKKKSRGLSTGAIIGIVFAIVGAVSITIIAYILFRRSFNKKVVGNTNITTIANSDFGLKTQ